MDTKKEVRKSEGFTLIEILVVIGLIALLAAIVLIAINPARQFAQGRNTQRTSNVETILNAVGQNMADNKGVLNCMDTDVTPNVPITLANDQEYLVCDGTAGCVTVGTVQTIDFECLTPTYINVLPVDPSDGNKFQWTNGDNYNTGYTITKKADGRIVVKAPEASSETALGATPPTVEITR